MFSEAIKKVISSFSRLPGIGPRQAARISIHLARLGPAYLEEFISSLSGLKNVAVCSNCFFLNQNHSGSLCSICSDSSRDLHTVAVVERETDLVSLEKSGRFRGRYLVIGELRRSGDFDDFQRERLASFTEQAASFPDGKFKEIILAVNPTSFGDLNAILLARALSPLAERLTRLGRGLPTGGEIEFADVDTLAAALDNRR